MTEDAPTLDKTEARQADGRKDTKVILFVSTAAAALALGVVTMAYVI